MAAFDSKLGQADTRGIQPVISRAPADTSGERDQMVAAAIGTGAKAAGAAYAKSQAASLAGGDVSLAEANQQADIVETKIEEGLQAEINRGPVNPQRAAEIKDAALSEFAKNDRVLMSLRDRGALTTVEARARRTLNLKRALSNPINSMFRNDFINAAKDLTGGGGMEDLLQETPAEKEERLIREKKSEATAKFEAEKQDYSVRMGITPEQAAIHLQNHQADLETINRLNAVKAERELKGYEVEELFTTSRSAHAREMAAFVKEQVTASGNMGLDAAAMAGGSRMIESMYQTQLQQLRAQTGITGDYRDKEEARLKRWKEGQTALVDAFDKAKLDKSMLAEMETLAQKIGWENLGDLMAYKSMDPRFLDIMLKSGDLSGWLDMQRGDKSGTNFKKAAEKLGSMAPWLERGEVTDKNAEDVAAFMNTPEGTNYISGSVAEEGAESSALPKVSEKTAGVYAKATETSLKSFTSGVAMMASQNNQGYRGEVMKAVDIASDKIAFLNRHQGQNGEITIEQQGTIGRNKRPRMNLNIPDGLKDNAGEIKQLYRVVEKQPWIWEHVADQYVDAADAFNGLMRGEWQPEMNDGSLPQQKSGARGTRLRNKAPIDKGTELKAPDTGVREADEAELRSLMEAELAGDGAPTPEQEARLLELLEQRVSIRDRERTGGKPVDPRPTMPEKTKVDTTVVPDFDRTLKEFENNKNYPKSGWDGSVWKPHPSIEGGSDTIAYGHKLTPEEVKTGTLTIGNETVDYITDGLTDAQAEALFKQDKGQHEKYVAGKFPEAKGAQAQVLTMMNYQGVDISKWPNSRKAVKAALKSQAPEDWLAAQAHILNSKWATSQTPERALETVHMLYPETDINVLKSLQQKYMKQRGAA